MDIYLLTAFVCFFEAQSSGFSPPHQAQQISGAFSLLLEASSVIEEPSRRPLKYQKPNNEHAIFRDGGMVLDFDAAHARKSVGEKLFQLASARDESPPTRYPFGSGDARKMASKYSDDCFRNKR